MSAKRRERGALRYPDPRCTVCHGPYRKGEYAEHRQSPEHIRATQAKR
jgi:hypothetical protein